MAVIRKFIKVKKYEIHYKLSNSFGNDENEDYFK